MKVTWWDEDNAWTRRMRMEVWTVDDLESLEISSFNGKRYVALDELKPLVTRYQADHGISYEAIDYIKETLEEQGFTVWIAYTGTLMISWMRSGKVRNTAVKSTNDYRPFVYDESAMEATLSRLR